MPTNNSHVPAAGNTDEAAFREFYNKYYPRVMAYLRKALQTDFYAEDIAQDAFVRFWKSRVRPNDPTVDVEAYFFTILRNAIASYFKNLLKEQELIIQGQAPADTVWQSSHTDDLINYKTSLALYETTLSNLSHEKQRCFRMHREQGFTYREIAEQEGLSERTVKLYISDTLKLLRKQLPAFGILFF